ncbi:hypothetical protein TrRE_jg3782 [Triparma retinervis]|uniref:JmjC domain-containing protein n=1 Tax=Triparma retinervis TaxID=2557542 RepID=A0A9W7AIB6_9STRA|nr:hypothetical protein TrRE_jg3782 [Triparma retinervis]
MSSTPATLPPLSSFPLDLSSLSPVVSTSLEFAYTSPTIKSAEDARASTFPFISGDTESPLYNDAYSAASLILGRRMVEGAMYTEALRALDLGMLRGGVEKWCDTYKDVCLAAQEGKEREERGELVSEGGGGDDNDDGGDGGNADDAYNTDDAEKADDAASAMYGSGSPIPRIPQSSLPLSAFTSDYLTPSKPCVITLAEAPCPEWTFERLKNRFGGRLVPVEVVDEKDRNKGYLGKSWDKEIMTFGGYLDEHVMGKKTPSKVGYLAQHPLLSQIPNLLSDLPTLPYTSALDSLDRDAPPSCEFRSSSSPLLSAWVGPADTVSPLHNDPYHNLYLQIQGRKYVRIYGVDDTEKVYPMKGERCNTSSVNIDDPDPTLHPLFPTATYQEVILSPGDMLYIPRLSWHYVRAVEPAVNVSMWWGARMGLRERGGAYKPVY